MNHIAALKNQHQRPCGKHFRHSGGDLRTKKDALCNRGKFDLVFSKAMVLSDGIARKGQDVPVDMDDAGMRLTLDVVAMVHLSTAIANLLLHAMILSADRQGLATESGYIVMLQWLQASFGCDTHAVDFTHNSIIFNLPCALEELQKRMTNPFRALSWNRVSDADLLLAKKALYIRLCGVFNRKLP